MDSDLPVLIIMRALMAKGWQRGEPPNLHTFDSVKLFGEKDFVARKPYLQCLLVLQQLFDRGLTGLSSVEPNAYYRLIMHAQRPADIRIGQQSKEYDKQADSVVIQNMVVDPLPAHESEDEEAETSATLALFAEEMDQDAGPAQVTSVQQKASDQGSDGQRLGRVEYGGSSGSGGAGSDLVVEDGEPITPSHRRQWTSSLPNITLDVHLSPGQRGHYRRLIIACPYAHTHHADGKYPCMKHKNLGQRQMAALGPREPEAFLGAWAAAADRFPNCQAHVAWNPSVAQVRAWMTSQGWPM